MIYILINYKYNLKTNFSDGIISAQTQTKTIHKQIMITFDKVLRRMCFSAKTKEKIIKFNDFLIFNLILTKFLK